MRDASLTGLAVVVGVLALASVAGWWLRRRDGRLRAVAPPPAGAGDPTRLPPGVRPGAVNLVQFSSEFCAPCRAARRVLEQVAATVPGVHLVELDAAEHLDVVRELGVWSTPTVLVVDSAGRVVRRATGVPDRQELIAAVTSRPGGVPR